MRLACIREIDARNEGSKRPDIPMPRNAEAAIRLFERGLAALRAGDDHIAFAIFDCLSRYEGDAPPQLVAIAKVGKEFLDPERTAEQRAKTLYDFFSPTLIRVYEGDEAGNQPMSSSARRTGPR
jgi:hypothetical protein